MIYNNCLFLDLSCIVHKSKNIVYYVYMQQWIPYQLALTIGVFLILLSGIVYTKPSMIYHDNGSVREFGIGTQKKTIVPLWLCVLLMAIMSYIVVYYTLHYKNQL